MDKTTVEAYCTLLEQELLLAEGCTEPIAIAYAAALVRRTLGKLPGSLEMHCSRSIIKNAKSAVVPNLGGLKGIRAAAVAGVVGGRADKELEVLSNFDTSQLEQVNRLLSEGYCTVKLLESDDNLHIIAQAFENADGSGENARVEIKHKHTHIASIQKNGELLSTTGEVRADAQENSLYKTLSLAGIHDFATQVDIEKVSALLKQQLEHNIAICEEGLNRQYGAGIGRILRDDDDVERLACAYAAAGSDARMSGCSMAVVINSGSGNQGITVTAPVWVYAKHLGADEEKLLRALAISNLVSIYIKSMIGRLSAYCGAVSAACGSGAGICYLNGGSFSQIAHAVSNALVNISGILCDGAKPSCAAKIASSVQAAILGYKMAMKGANFLPGDGVIGSSPEKTLRNIGFLASEGLVKIDQLMLKLMLEADE